MKKLLYKDVLLCTPPQVPMFFAFAFMLLIPSYPYLVAGFFICNAVFYSFVTASMENDVLFSLLLPVSKAQIVRGKMVFVEAIQLISLAFFSGAAALNFAIHQNKGNSAGVDASLTLIGAFLILFSVFNQSYIPKFYKAPHKAGKIFLISAIFMFSFIFVFEGFMIAAGAAAENVPFFAWIEENLDTFPTTPTAWASQAVFFGVCVIIYIVSGIVCRRRAEAEFDKAEI